jgi:hypothetical protein
MRDVVERSLTEPVEIGDSEGNRQLVPPTRGNFHLERVEVTGTSEAPTISVLFRFGTWSDLFGIAYPVTEMYQGAPDGYISVYIAEQLFAEGFGIENARQEERDGVTWLRWDAL